MQATFASYKSRKLVSGCYSALRISSSDTPSADGPEMAAKLIQSPWDQLSMFLLRVLELQAGLVKQSIWTVLKIPAYNPKKGCQNVLLLFWAC